MISSKEIKQMDFVVVENGYSQKEVDSLLSEVADTIDAYQKESDELYHKLEVLATKIEEYRQEENAIKTALVTAEKMAEKIKAESNETANNLISSSKETAKNTIDEANAEADKIVSNARDYTSKLINDKTNEANEIITNAQNKANDAINSAKIVAQDILDQAKQISEDLISKSKAEKEAYEILTNTIKADAKEFIAKVKALYNEELEALNSANLDTNSEPTNEAQQDLNDISDDVSSLVEEIEEVSNSIPEPVVLDALPVQEADEEASVPEQEEVEQVEEQIDDKAEDEPKQEENSADEFVNIVEYSDEPAIIELEEDDEITDPMEAVQAFSKDSFTPISSTPTVNEITDEADMEEQSSLFDEAQLPFESYFNVKRDDAHNDKSQVISLVPPEEEVEEEPKFRGFFKKKNK